MSYKNLICIVCFIAAAGLAKADLANFDDYALSPDSHYSGSYPSDGAGGYSGAENIISGGASFVNYSDGDWLMWEGFAFSNETDTVTSGYENQFSVFAGLADSGSNFAIAYEGFTMGAPTMNLGTSTWLESVAITNTTYATLAMLNGEGPATAFDADDFFKLTIEGFDSLGGSTGTVVVDLADGTNILDTWQTVGLRDLGVVKSLEFSLESSDVGDFGMNTPAYFAMDSLTAVPEPMTLALLGLGGLMIRRKRA